MMDLWGITDRSRSCWYELFFNPGKPAVFDGDWPELIVQVHREVVKSAEVLPSECALRLFEGFGFHNFAGDLTGGNKFGFDQEGLTRRETTDGEFVDFVAPLFFRGQEVTCPDCGGSRERSYLFEGECCPWCRGSGRVKQIDWQSLDALLASLYLLFSYPLSFEGETYSSRKQLLALQTTCRKGQNGSGISGVFSFAICKLLSDWFQAGRRTIPEITRAMQIARQCMTGAAIKDYEFEAKIMDDDGQLHIKCPGENCVLSSGSADIKKGRGSGFYTSGNADNSVQQLTLLVALATLHHLAREAGI